MITNNEINSIYKKVVGKFHPELLKSHHILIARPKKGSETTGSIVYQWNLHVHGKPRKQQKPYLLLGVMELANKHWTIRYVFDMPYETVYKAKNVYLYESVRRRGSWIDRYERFIKGLNLVPSDRQEYERLLRSNRKRKQKVDFSQTPDGSICPIAVPRRLKGNEGYV